MLLLSLNELNCMTNVFCSFNNGMRCDPIHCAFKTHQKLFNQIHYTDLIIFLWKMYHFVANNHHALLLTG